MNFPEGSRMRFFRYELPLHAPIEIGNHRIEKRAGYLACCESAGVKGWGDIAPLPGYSPESMELVEECLTSPSQKAASEWPASVRFGVDFAIRNFLCHASNVTLCENLGRKLAAGHVRTARLITDDAGQASLSHVHRFPVVKIKVGKRPVEEEIVRVNGIMDDLPPSQKVRLDANRAWLLPDCLRFYDAVDRARIEFIEEPLADLAQYRDLDARADVPYALDESLSRFTLTELDALKHLVALVIKPTLVGSASDCARYVEWGRRREKALVISSAYESGVGMRSLIALAASVGGDTVAGLDTYSRLADDVASPHLGLCDGAYEIRDTFAGSWQVIMDKVSEI